MVNSTIDRSEANMLKIARKLAIVQAKYLELDKLFRLSGSLVDEDLDDMTLVKSMKEELLNQLAKTMPNWKEMI